MIFTPEMWRTEATEKLKTLHHWFTQRLSQNLPYPVYSTLVGLALYPPVHISRQPNGIWAVLGVVQDVTNYTDNFFITDQLKQWQAQELLPDEKEIIQWVTEQITQYNRRWQAFNPILDFLQVMSIAQTVIPATEWMWIEKAWREEHNQLQQATLSGSGAIAQGEGATAVGEGGVKAGDVGGSITTIHAAEGANVIVGEPSRPQSYRPDKRVLDAAIARQVPVNTPTELVAMIRQTDSGRLLAEFDISEEQRAGIQSSKPFPLSFPVATDGTLRPAEVFLRIDTQDFALQVSEKKLEIPVGGDSMPCRFSLTPLRPGKLSLLLEVLTKDQILIAQGTLTTNGTETLSAEKVVTSIMIFVMSPASKGSGEGIPDEGINPSKGPEGSGPWQLAAKQVWLHQLYEKGLLDSETYKQIVNNFVDLNSEINHQTANRLARVLSSEVSYGTRYAAAEALGEVGFAAVEPLVEILEKAEDSETLRFAIQTLGRIGAVQPLLDALRHWYEPVRGIARATLNQRGFILHLLPDLEDENPKVRQAAIQAITSIRTQYWIPPYGEPEWAEIPAGEFIMGSNRYGNEQPVHRVYVPRFAIARTPITNAQYQLFVAATNHRAPYDWQNAGFPQNLESHPVVGIFWNDAIVYCRWLSQVTGQEITLPSEAEWEKAARGDKDAREYPWGDTFDRFRCNTWELGIHGTTPVGIFLNGASPYGVLDMSGNVWEWTRSQYRNYPYQADDGREGMDSGGWRVLRGGAWFDSRDFARAAFRLNDLPVNRNAYGGFRVVRRPPSR